MHPSNWSNLGWLTLQDWDDNRILETKHVMGAMRMEAPEDPEGIIPDNLSEGHILGGMSWGEIARQDVDTWWITPPAVSYFEEGGDAAEEPAEEDVTLPPFDGNPAPALSVLPRPSAASDADGAVRALSSPLGGEAKPDRTTTTRAKGGGWSALVDSDTTDDRLPAKRPKMPAWAKSVKYPVGWVSTILSGAKNLERGPQDEILLPGFFGLVAPNRGGVPQMGTPVWELKEDKTPDFLAPLQSLMSVEKVGGSGALALQLGGDKLSGASGFMLLSDWNAGAGVLASASNYQGGPFLTGGKGDQHNIGTSGDGKTINAAHLSTQTLFKGSGFDCPLMFEPAVWPKPDSGPHKILVHLVNDTEAVHSWAKGAGQGMGRWYADAFFYADDPPPEDPGPGLHGPEDPFVQDPPPPPPPPGGGGGVSDPGGGVAIPGLFKPEGPVIEPPPPGGGGGGFSGGGGTTSVGGGDDTGGGGYPPKPDGPVIEPTGGPIGGPPPGFTGTGAHGGFPPIGGGTGGDGGSGEGDGGSVVFVKDSEGNLNPVTPPGGLSPEELAEWVEANWGKDPPYDVEQAETNFNGGVAPDRPHWAVASNTVLFGGGMAFKAQAYSAGSVDMTGAVSVSDEDKALAAQAPVVGYAAAYGVGDGSWDGWVYTPGLDGADGNRPNTAGGTMLLPPDVDVADVIAGTAQTDVGPVTQAYPPGMGETGWGTPDPSTGGIHSGVTAAPDGAGGVGFIHYGSDGLINVAVGWGMGEGGLDVTGNASVSGKLEVGGMIDPVGIAFAEQSSRPAAWPQPSGGVFLPGLYASDDAGANKPLWVRDDGTEIDLSEGGVEVLFTHDGTSPGNVGSGEDTLITYTLPGGTLANPGDEINVRCSGTVGNGFADTCRFRVYFGATVLTVHPESVLSDTPWAFDFTVTRVDATNQRWRGVRTVQGSTVAVVDLAVLTAAETLAGDIVVKITGENAGGTNDSVNAHQMTVEKIAAP